MRVPKSIIDHAIDGLSYIEYETIYGCDLHHELFNTDYFIVGYHEAEKWLIKNGGVFNAVEKIKEYEQDNFGEVYTDFSSSEKVANMLAYILGEELLSQTSLHEFWDYKLSREQIDKLLEELEEML